MAARSCKELQEVTWDYRGFKGVTKGNEGLQGLERVRRGYKEL